MQVETDRVWKVGGRHRVSVELSTRIPYEFEEVTTRGRRHPARLFAWFDVSAQRTRLDGFGPVVPLIREIDPPRSHRLSTANLDFRVAVTAEAITALLGRSKQLGEDITLRFRFRGVFRSRRDEVNSLVGGDVWGPMGVFALSPHTPKTWLLEVPAEPIHTDFVEGLTFEVGDADPTPRLEIQVVSAPERPGDELELRWAKEHIDQSAHILLQRARGKSWATIGLLEASGRFEPEPSNLYRADGDQGTVNANLGTNADAGGTFRLQLAVVDRPDLDQYSPPFDVQVARIELGSEPQTIDQPFDVHWILQPYPEQRATINLERFEGDAWITVGTLTRKNTFERSPDKGRRFRTPGPMGARPGVSIGELGRAGGQLRLTLRVEELGLSQSTASFSLAPA